MTDWLTHKSNKMKDSNPFITYMEKHFLPLMISNDLLMNTNDLNSKCDLTLYDIGEAFLTS